MEEKNKDLKEFNEYLKFRKVAVIGLGVSNKPLLSYLYFNKAKVTVFDEKTIDEIPKDIMDKITELGFQFSLGKNSLDKLKGFDVIFRSPSVLPTRPQLLAEAARGAIVTTEIEMLMKIAPCKIIGVTGSDGKTTTTTLISEILKKAKYNVFLGGNIGIPLFTKLEQMKSTDIIVLELSSFQLMGMDISPNISLITNITPNHLNIHKDYNEYIDAKKNIFKYQNPNDILVVNYDNRITRSFQSETPGKIVFYSGIEKLSDGFIVDDNVIKECEEKVRKHIIRTDQIILRGKHNYENVAAAIAVTSHLVDMETIISAIEEFKPVEHRIEYIKTINNAKWYNDSVSSSPTRTIAGLNSFEEDIVLIAGGYDKNLDYTPLAPHILNKVQTLILIGQTANKIYEATKKEADRQRRNINIYMAKDLEAAAILAKKHVKKGQVVLLSPASASFDMFKDFADRGNTFKKIVQNI